MLADPLLTQLRALTDRGLLHELARTEDALREDRLARVGEHTVRPPGRERMALLAHQQQVIDELTRRRSARLARSRA